MEVEERLEQIINEEVAERISEVEKEYVNRISNLEKENKEYKSQISVLADKLLGLQKEIEKLKRARGLNY